MRRMLRITAVKSARAPASACLPVCFRPFEQGPERDHPDITQRSMALGSMHRTTARSTFHPVLLKEVVCAIRHSA
jgi:hypothetical protein